MPSNYLLISRIPLSENVDKEILLNKQSLSESDRNRYFVSVEGDTNELLETRAYTEISEIESDEESLENIFTDLADIVCGDIKRELVKHVESPIKSNNAVPATKYVQLRHVEVLPEKYQGYREWREETIFNVVRENEDKITSFDAYHSLISGVPGVMFVSSFNGDIEEYIEPFTNDNYREIVQQAGDGFITGGKEGLYTKIYQALSL